ncbi:MarR family protein [Planctomycetes bacterium CA13]|uniref:MarR family protein n=1 Tax=Novipirellula herctigrandis TaxID=2527986 RepID=A0A5C5Z948_9BACT|nr:MarR family protein [Planctomycetes bacterium CA13]
MPSTPNTISQPESLRSVDRALLVVMRSGEAFGVGELTEQLGVTATAIRQRIERLLEMGLIERQKIVAGRGRPTFEYQLTVDGHRSAGANPADLAEAMWQEILAIPDSEIRQNVLSAVAARLGRRVAEGIHRAAIDDESLESRMKRVSEMLAERHIAAEISHTGALPVIDVGACPYPSLTDTSDDRAMCRLEEEMLSEALGRPVHLSSCRLDGDHLCQFATDTSSVDSSN